MLVERDTRIKPEDFETFYNFSVQAQQKGLKLEKPIFDFYIKLARRLSRRQESKITTSMET